MTQYRLWERTTLQGLEKDDWQWFTLGVWTDKWLFDSQMRTSLMKNPLIDLYLKMWLSSLLRSQWFQKKIIGVGFTIKVVTIR
ncbi:unnamed protein product [Arabis nemorensis]|uniref:Uncharacterized protein n=1 Tax=Arabis nemorensis TaxID=586526 RepID=A0A565CLL6_9BRAS|nr:unnamed protein product [Arabis nemorensis]